MKKSSFTALVMGMFSGMLFAIGMCMALLPEWDAFVPGVIFGALGVVLALATLIVWRRMEHKAPLHLSREAIITIAVIAAGVAALGVGMCLCLLWNKMITGVIVGMFGLAAPLSLIPLVKGLHD